MKGWRLLPLLASAALLLSACSSSPGPSSTPQRGANDASLEGAIVEQRWNLLLVGTDERLSMPETPFFQISKEGKVSGHDGCNRFTGEVTLGENQRIEFSPLATTRMACPGEVATLERDFLATLNNVSGWQIEGKTLTLTDEQGVSRARLEAVQLY